MNHLEIAQNLVKDIPLEAFQEFLTTALSAFVAEQSNLADVEARRRLYDIICTSYRDDEENRAMWDLLAVKILKIWPYANRDTPFDKHGKPWVPAG